jgi:HAMP domain-containing protein/signal transduction histidine kinase/DNA-binding response OmpR family regulator
MKKTDSNSRNQSPRRKSASALAERPPAKEEKAPSVKPASGRQEMFDTSTLLRILRAVRKGDFSVRMPEDQTGSAGEIAEALNDVIDLNDRVAKEFERVSRAVGRDGRINQRASIGAAAGSWEVCIESVNSMITDLVHPTTEVARVIGAVAKGDLSQTMALEIDGRPIRGEFLRVANTVNKLVEQLSSFATEVTRVAREVGTEGKLGGQAEVKGVAGTWKDLTENVNLMAANLTAQVRNIAEVTTAVANGDLSKKITVDVKGEILELKNTINTMVDQLRSFAAEVTRVAREVGTEGKLGGQADVRGVTGAWKDLTDNVNMMAANLTAQVRNIAQVTTAVANGDFSRKITIDVKGEILELKDTINEMVDQLGSFASEVTRVAREVGTEGKLGGQAQVKGVTGAWRDLTDSVNLMAANLTAQVRNIAEVTTAVAKGDLSKKITVDVKGEILELKKTINTMVDQLGSFAAEVTRVAREVGTEGKLGGQADVPGVTGAWKSLTDSVNLMASNLTAQVRNIAEVTTAVANGDLSKKITVEVKGEILDLKKTINTMVDQLSSFAAEVTRVAREVGTEGKLGGQADVKGVGGVWRGLTDNVNLMASNLTGQVRNIADVTTAVANGDLSKKITVDVKGEILELKNTINTMVDQLATFAAEVTRVAREVGTEGKLGGQAEVKGVGGTWKDLTDSVNLMASNLTAQVRNIADVTTAVANGDLSKKITVDVKGEILELKNTINTMVDQLRSFASEVTRVAREVGTEGKLGGQADVRGVTGAWKDLTDNVNMMAANLTAQVRNIAEVTTAVANGDLSKKIDVDVKGEILELKNTINTMVDQLRSFASEVTRVAREVGTEGKLGGQADVKGVGGTWKDLTDSVNLMASNLTAQVRNIAEVTTAVANGDLTKKITVDVKGEILELKNTINTMVDQLRSFASEVTRVAREVGTEGKLGGQAEVKGVAGTWKDLTDSVNLMASNLTAQVRNIAEVTTAVARGDLTKKITVDVRGEILELKNTINVMVDQLSSFAAEVTRVAREVGTEGKLGGQADVRGVAGTWKGLTDSVNLMASNLTAQVRNIAEVTTAVANGDLSKKITVDVRGEILELKNTINTMVDQLSSFASEVTRVARDVGTEGKLGGQAEVKGVGGVWKDLTDNVNIMANNLTSQVRGIARVVTAVANGDLKRKLTVEAKGEIAELADTINSMIDTLDIFADQVTTVAREVGVEGKLGGQAKVPGAAGTWRDLTDNVNQLAANLTAQVRAIADVATSVTQGDLTRYITVEAQGEVAKLKDNINEMIRNLKDTTQKNTEQDWLKTNIAKFTGMLQGHRDLLTVAKLILSELAPLVNAQHGVFYISDVDESNYPVLKLLGSYAYRERKNIANVFKFGEGLIGECALEKERILVTNVPHDYIHVSSGLGDAPPANIIVLPVIFEGQVKAVIELASFHKFSEIHTQFLDQLTESIGIVLNTIAANMRTESLLAQSQSLTEELQKQQEELKDTNQRLKEQAASLKASEELLKEQQEALRHTNEELEDKAQLLAQQKSEVELKNHEVELAKQALEEKANQLTLTSKYKSEFLANMSHELRTPLNSLLILSQLLAENPEGNLAPQQVEFANTIHSAGTDLLALISDILDLSKIESGTMAIEVEEVEMLELHNNMERSFRQVAHDKALEFDIVFDQDLPRNIRTDSKRLQQVLKNLLSNAFKFTHRGSVELKVATAKRGWSPENQVLNRAERVVAFSVSDTGIGVPVEKQKIIFEAFQQADGTTSRKYGGTGLGLSISREIANLLGGEIAVNSAPGMGSTFTLYLPQVSIVRQKLAPIKGEFNVASAEAATAGGSAAAYEQPQLHQEMQTSGVVADDRDNVKFGERSLLVIENDERVATRLVALGRQFGFKVLVALRGDVGVVLARKYKPSAIMLNARLRGVNGWSLLDRFKHDPGVAHIPVTILGVETDRQQSLTLGAIGCCDTAADQDELETVMKHIKDFIDRPVKNLLVVEDNDAQQRSIATIIGNGDVKVHGVRTAAEALSALKEMPVDCMIADLGLPDMDGGELVEKVRRDMHLEDLPIIAYTGKDLSDEEQRQLKQKVQTVIMKDVRSAARLLAETAFYLHRRSNNMSEGRRRLIESFRQRDPLLAGKKVLIVDDDSRNIMALRSLLERHKVKVLAAENGKKGIETVIDNPDIDLVLMDVMMPEMDGYETTRAIRDFPEFKNLPIIALTAKAMQGDREKCLEAGSSDYIAKPVDHDQLMSLFRVWLANRIHVRDDVNEQDSPIDLELLSELHTPESLPPVLELFLHEASNLVSKLKFDLEQHNGISIAAVSHDLKGLAGVMTVLPLYKLGQRLEECGRKNDFEAGWEVHKQISEVLAAVSELVNKFVASLAEMKNSAQS